MSNRGSGRRPTVAVGVEPPLLGELLGRALHAAGLDVVRVQPDGALTVSHYDLAVVSGDWDGGGAALLRLPEEGTRSGTVRTVQGVQLVDLGDVAAVVEVVRRLV